MFKITFYKIEYYIYNIFHGIRIITLSNKNLFSCNFFFPLWNFGYPTKNKLKMRKSEERTMLIYSTFFFLFFFYPLSSFALEFFPTNIVWNFELEGWNVTGIRGEICSTNFWSRFHLSSPFAAFIFDRTYFPGNGRTTDVLV